MSKYITLVEGDFVCNIPKGMTNGEVMKAMLPDIEVTINKFLGSVVIDGAFGKFVTTLDWWNAPYKGVSE